VDHAPVALRPYLRLARYDRPVGFWLLAIPCWQGLTLAAITTGLDWSVLYWVMLFGLGAVAMRGAGCIYNDIVDRDLDVQVTRSANRPLAAGTLTLKQAWIFLFANCGVGLLVLVQLPRPAILTSLVAVGLVAAYPFMKRITWWPQAWLGLTFNWGVPVAGATVLGSPFAPEIILLYGSALFWTLGYDTIYACQDMEDDALIGVKSSAQALGDHLVSGVRVFYLISIALALASGVLAGATLFFAIGFAIYAAHLLAQTRKLDPEKGADCLKRFKANRITGLILTAAFVLGGM